ncbi:hypothetical protein A5844_001923, partial [Enterococcus sp. 10A9_DIV0425]
MGQGSSKESQDNTYQGIVQGNSKDNTYQGIAQGNSKD